MSMHSPAETLSEKEVVAEAEKALDGIKAMRSEIGKVIFGQEQVVENAIVAILSGGHALLVGVPGLAKTKLVDTLGTVLGISAGRIQFTPDLMPSDILGSEVLEQSEDGKRSFRFVKGPIFTQLLMADEINRASPRTQSALLQAMQEYHVTFGGERHDLPAPFHVLATQNPLEQEGTYPLPEAQLDRFLLQIDVDYPSIEAERQILLETTGTQRTGRKPRVHRRKADETAAACAPHAGARKRRQRDPRSRALGASRHRPCRHRRPCRLGPRPACQPGADAVLRAPARFMTAASRPPSTTSRRWPSRCCSTAWR
jgi:MoxR-like ATPase